MQKLREEIDKLDAQLIELLQARFDICDQIGEYKKLNHLPIENCDREKQILNGISNQHTRAVFETIFKQSKMLQKK